LGGTGRRPARSIALSPHYIRSFAVSNIVRIFLPSLLLVFGATLALAESNYPPDTVVASRGGAVVTMLDVDAALLNVPKRLRANVMNNPKRIEELIERLLINRQVALEAKAAKLDQGAVYARASQQQEERLLTELRMADLRANFDIGNVQELARERYMVNPDAYAIPGSTNARHVLIETKDRSNEEARELAEAVRAKAVAGEDFIALVKQYSDDSTKASSDGLVLGADSDSMADAFAEAVKKLAKPGDISPVTKTPFGYHVISLVARVPARPRSFEEVQDRIVAEIENTLRDTRAKEHIDELKAMELTATPEVVASLRTRYLPDGSSAEARDPESK